MSSSTCPEILVVEDNSMIARILYTALDRCRLSVSAWEDPQKALEFLETNSGSIRVVVTDIDMPGLNGFELCERALEISPELEFIFISGAHSWRDLDHNNYLGRFPFIPKPFRISHFLEVLSDRLGTDDPITPDPVSS